MARVARPGRGTASPPERARRGARSSGPRRARSGPHRRDGASGLRPRPSYSVALPAMRDYTLGPNTSNATFTLLRADVSSRTIEKAGLRIRLRMMNRTRYDTNFWDSSFRLIVDGVPMAPEGGLNELVPGESAKEGDVLFAISRGTAGAKLKITFNDDSTEIPLDLTPPR